MLPSYVNYAKAWLDPRLKPEINTIAWVARGTDVDAPKDIWMYAFDTKPEADIFVAAAEKLQMNPDISERRRNHASLIIWEVYPRQIEPAEDALAAFKQAL
jgi:hypothetical protein